MDLQFPKEWENIKLLDNHEHIGTTGVRKIGGSYFNREAFNVENVVEYDFHGKRYQTLISGSGKNVDYLGANEYEKMSRKNAHVLEEHTIKGERNKKEWRKHRKSTAKEAVIRKEKEFKEFASLYGSKLGSMTEGQKIQAMFDFDYNINLDNPEHVKKIEREARRQNIARKKEEVMAKRARGDKPDKPKYGPEQTRKDAERRQRNDNIRRQRSTPDAIKESQGIDREERMRQIRRMFPNESNKEFDRKMADRLKQGKRVSEKEFRHALLRLHDMEGKSRDGIMAKAGAKYARLSGTRKAGLIAAFGVKMGVGHSLMDNDDDTVLSTALTSTMYGLGGALVGKVINGHAEQYKEFEFERAKAKQMVSRFQDQLAAEDYLARKMAPETNRKNAAGRRIYETYENNYERILKTIGEEDFLRASQANAEHAKRIVKTGRTALGMAKLGGAAIIAGGALSVLHGMKKEYDSDRLVEEQEFKLKKQEKMRKQAMARNGYGDLPGGQIVLDLFNEQIGHFKMGDSKFR